MRSFWEEKSILTLWSTWDVSYPSDSGLSSSESSSDSYLLCCFGILAVSLVGKSFIVSANYSSKAESKDESKSLMALSASADELSWKKRWLGSSARIYLRISRLVIPRSKTVWGQAVPAHLDLRSRYSSNQSWAFRTPFGFSGSSISVLLAHQIVWATTLIRISRFMGHLVFEPGKNQPLRQHISKTSALRRP